MCSLFRVWASSAISHALQRIPSPEERKSKQVLDFAGSPGRGLGRYPYQQLLRSSPLTTFSSDAQTIREHIGVAPEALRITQRAGRRYGMPVDRLGGPL